MAFHYTAENAVTDHPTLAGTYSVRIEMSSRNYEFANPDQGSDGSAHTEEDIYTVLKQRVTAPTWKVDSLPATGEAQENDPARWELRGTVDGFKWDLVDKRAKQEFCSRFQDNVYTIAKPKKYKKFRHPSLALYARYTPTITPLQAIRLTKPCPYL